MVSVADTGTAPPRTTLAFTAGEKTTCGVHVPPPAMALHPETTWNCGFEETMLVTCIVAPPVFVIGKSGAGDVVPIDWPPKSSVGATDTAPGGRNRAVTDTPL